MKGMGIYRILNKVSGVLYIGSSVNLARRFSQHKTDLNALRHGNSRLQRAWNKYGSCAFTFEVVEMVDSASDLLVREQHWIDISKATGDIYNLAPIAGNTLGCAMSDETRRKISESKRGEKWSDERRANMSRIHTGRKLSEETKAKISASKTGARNKHSEETKRKMSIARLGNKNALGHIQTEEHRRNIGLGLLGKKHPRKPRVIV